MQNASTYAPMVHSIHVLRGRWRAQPSATKERYGCGLPLAGAHRPAAEYSGNEQKRNDCSLPANACSTFVGTISYRENSNSAPEEGVQAAERPKNRARQRAIWRVSKRIFLPTFSGATEKVGPRSDGCGAAAFNSSPVNPDKRADVHPQGVGRIRSAPSSLTAALAIGPYKLLCRVVCEATVAVSPHATAVR